MRNPLFLKAATTRLLFPVFLLALLIRLLWAILAESYDPFLIRDPLLGDAASYHRIAINLLAGNGFAYAPDKPSSFWPPLYPFSLAAVLALFGQNLLAARLIQAVWGAIPPVVFSWIALKSLGKTQAYLVGFGLALYPYLIYFGAWLIAEALFMMIYSLVFLGAWLFAHRLQVRWLVLTAFFLGLSILAKPSTLFMAPFLALWVAFSPVALPLKSRLGHVFILTLVTIAVVLPWSIRNYLVFNHFVLVSSNGGYTFLGANNPNAWGGHNEFYPPLIPGLTDAEMEDVFFSEAWQWIGSHPGDFARLAVIKVHRLFSPLSVASQPQDFLIPGATLVYFFYRLFLLIALLGIIMGLKHWRAIGYLYAPVIGVLLSTILYYGDARYTIPMAPSLVMFSSLPIAYGIRWIGQSSRLKLKLGY